VHRALVSLLDFKSSVACYKRAGWVRFPHAPAIPTLILNGFFAKIASKERQ
jgi:hypothetical protein